MRLFPCNVTLLQSISLILLNEFCRNDVNIGKVKINKCECARIKSNAFFMRNFHLKMEKASRSLWSRRFGVLFNGIFSRTYIECSLSDIPCDVVVDFQVEFRSMLSGRAMKAQTLSKSSEASPRIAKQHSEAIFRKLIRCKGLSM